MEFKKILVTPSLAAKYLEANIMNRHANEPTVLHYANQMRKGDWKEDTGECIKISKEGVILDGQHRLMAVIKANKPIYFHIAMDMDKEVFDVLDTGKCRSAGDVFKIQGIKYATSTPAIINYYHLFKKEQYHKGIAKNGKLSNSQLLAMYEEKAEYWNAIVNKAETFSSSFSRVISSALFGGIYATLLDINPSKALPFLEQFSTGRNITNESIHVLRDKLIADRVSNSKMSPALKMAFIIKTWNAFVTDRNLKVLRFDKVKEDFPVFMS